MAFHNTTARYFYSLGREGLLPRALGRTHPQVEEPAHRLDHPVRHRRDDRARVRAVHRDQRPGQPGLPPALRADGGHGRDHHPAVQALVSLSILHLLPAAPRRRGALVEDDGRPGAWPSSPRRTWLPAVQQHHFLGSGYGYAKWLGPIDMLVVPSVSASPSTSSAGTRRSTSRPAGSSTKVCEHRQLTATQCLAARPLAHPAGRRPGNGNRARGLRDCRNGLPDRGGHRVPERQERSCSTPDGTTVATAGQALRTMRASGPGWAEQDPALWRDGLAERSGRSSRPRTSVRGAGHPSGPGLAR